MTYIPKITKEFYSEVSQGNVANHTIVHKFGKNEDVGTSYEPLAIGGVYRTPQPASATTVRVKAGGNANDTAAGSGAREITIEGLDDAGLLTDETIATAGASASSATTNEFMRIFRCYVSESGTYASSSAGSVAAEIVIENGAGGTDWLTIEFDGLSRAQSQIGLYSVPLGYTAYVVGYVLTTNSTKVVDFLFFQRRSILDAAAPYEARRTVVEHLGIEGHFDNEFLGGQSFPELTDLGWMCKSASTAKVTVDFEILLIED